LTGIKAAQSIKKQLDIPVIYLTGQLDEITVKRGAGHASRRLSCQAVYRDRISIAYSGSAEITERFQSLPLFQ